MAARIRWGILGTGNIAGKFAEALGILPDAELVAVGSRSAATADAFATRYNVPRRHASYAELASDPAIDALYIATPHSLHAENTLLGLAAGKAVLCEKPFALNARQAAEVIAEARRRNLLVMEAMWTRFLPPIVRLRELLAGGAIGEPRMLTADFGFHGARREGRWFDLALGGGALLDVGVYPIALASMLFGTPTDVTGYAQIGPTGVDEEDVMILRHSKGELAALHTGIRVATPQEATVMGTTGRIHLHAGWWKGSDMTFYSNSGGEEFLEFPFTGNGYQFEAEAFMKCLREGQTECSTIPLDETLSIAQTLDNLRVQWGLKYPME